MQAADYLRTLRRHWVLLLVVMTAAGAITWFWSDSRDRTYAAETRLVIGPSRLRDQGDIPQTLDALTRRSIVTTFAEVVESGQTLRAAGRATGLGLTALELFKVEATGLPEANVVKVRVTGPWPRRTQQLLIEVAAAAGEYLEELYQVYAVEAIDPPEVPERPVAPQPMRDTAVAVFLAGVLTFLGRAGLDHARSTGRTAGGDDGGPATLPPITINLSMPAGLAPVPPAPAIEAATETTVRASVPLTGEGDGEEPAVEPGANAPTAGTGGEVADAVFSPPAPLPLAHWIEALARAAVLAARAGSGSSPIPVAAPDPAATPMPPRSVRRGHAGGLSDPAGGVRVVVRRRPRRSERERAAVRTGAITRFNGGRRDAP